MAEITSLIEQLANPDTGLRSEAAARLFAHGLQRGLAAAGPWFADPELSACFVFQTHGVPRTVVGIAVQPATFERIREANAAPRLADVPPDLDAIEFELPFPTAHLDILTTRDAAGGGAIARFLRKHGEGIQQVEWSVNNIDRATELLRDRFSVSPVYGTARSGAEGSRVNFFLVSHAAEKVLIELVESATD